MDIFESKLKEIRDNWGITEQDEMLPPDQPGQPPEDPRARQDRLGRTAAGAEATSGEFERGLQEQLTEAFWTYLEDWRGVGDWFIQALDHQFEVDIDPSDRTIVIETETDAAGNPVKVRKFKVNISVQEVPATPEAPAPEEEL